jgi:hypothetical protein
VAGRDPNWTRDELILALDLYVRHRPAVLGNTSVEVIELSEILNRLARADRARSPMHRNANSEAMKLLNLGPFVRSIRSTLRAAGSACIIPAGATLCRYGGGTTWKNGITNSTAAGKNLISYPCAPAMLVKVFSARPSRSNSTISRVGILARNSWPPPCTTPAASVSFSAPRPVATDKSLPTEGSPVKRV